MATYQSVQRQIAELQKKAEVLRKAEAAKVIAGIKAQIEKYALTPSDLFETVATSGSSTAVPAEAPKAAPAKKPTATKSEKLAPKYRDPVSKKTWNGWGKAPEWIKKGKREDFLIGKEKPAVAPKAVKAVAKKAAEQKAAKVVAAPSKKPVASKTPAAAPTSASKPVAKKAVVAPKAKPAPAPKVAVAAKTKPTAKKVAVAKPKAAPAKKAVAPKRPAAPPASPAPEVKSASVEIPVTTPVAVEVAPIAETGATAE